MPVWVSVGGVVCWCHCGWFWVWVGVTVAVGFQVGVAWILLPYLIKKCWYPPQCWGGGPGGYACSAGPISRLHPLISLHPPLSLQVPPIRQADSPDFPPHHCPCSLDLPLNSPALNRPRLFTIHPNCDPQPSCQISPPGLVTVPFQQRSSPQPRSPSP